MRMQPVLRFFEAHVHVQVVHDGVRDFFAAVGGQAVAHLAVCRSQLQEFVVDLEREEMALLLGLFAFLAHRDPHVAIEDVCVLDGFLGVVEYAVLTAMLLEAGLGFFYHLGGLFETLGAGQREVHAYLGGEGQERIGHVVAVADEGDSLGLAVCVLETAQVFANHLGKGDGLAGVVVVGQGVHHRDATVFGQFFYQLLLEATDHDGVDPAAEAAGHVLDAFSLAETDRIRGQQHGVAAQLVHAYLEGGDGAQRGLFEEHGDILAVEAFGHLARMDFFLEPGGNLHGFENLFLAPVGEAKEMLIAIDHLLSFGQNPIKKKKTAALL